MLVDNFRPTLLPSWGVTLEKPHQLRPGMIWASISSYGESGPYRDYPANGATTEPMAGLSSLHGYEGDRGMNTGGLYPDPVGGYFLVATILAALAHRDRTGQPQRVDLSMMESVASTLGDAFVEYAATGRRPGAQGNRHPRHAPHNVYPTKDGEWLAVAVESDNAWRGLVGHIGDPRLMDSRFDHAAGRKADESTLDGYLAEWCRQQDAAAAAASLGSTGVCAARVVSLYEVHGRPSANFAASGFIRRIKHPEAGATWLPGRPWRFSAAPAEDIRPAPCVGQHSREVLAKELGIGDDEYQALVATGVTGTLDELRQKASR